METDEKKEQKQTEKEMKNRKERISRWLKNPYNLALIAILIFSFIVLIYFFSVTKNQTLWWDEAEYMSIAKHWAFNTPEYKNPQRPPLFYFLAFLLYTVGFSDITIKFLLVLVPTWLVVLSTYLLIKEMYDKKVALIAAFITSVSWIHLFYAMRFMTDSLSLLFGILAIFAFWKGYINKKGNKYIWLIGLFVALSFMSRLTGILYGAVIVLFLVLTLQFKFLKNKHIWAVILVFLLMLTPFFFWSYSEFGNPLAFRKGYGGPGSSELGWWMLTLIYDYPEIVFFILFLVGLVTLVPMFLSLDIMLLKKDKTYYNDFFMLLSILFTLVFFIYFLRTGENRWLILMSIGIFTISAKGILFVYDLVNKNIGKVLAIALITLILISGAYFQLKHANNIINAKKDSYSQLKDAALWIKSNSNPDDVVLSVSYTQTIFYTERLVYTYSDMSEQQFEELIQNVSPRYLIVSGLEPHHPPWSYNMPEKYQKIMKPAQVYFADEARQQAILIVYEFI